MASGTGRKTLLEKGAFPSGKPLESRAKRRGLAGVWPVLASHWLLRRPRGIKPRPVSTWDNSEDTLPLLLVMSVHLDHLQSIPPLPDAQTPSSSPFSGKPPYPSTPPSAGLECLRPPWVFPGQEREKESDKRKNPCFEARLAGFTASFVPRFPHLYSGGNNNRIFLLRWL